MNMHRKRRPGTRLLMGLVLGALLGACGAELPTGSTVQTKSGMVTVASPTAGLSACMSCHPGTTAEWETSRHANLNNSPKSTGTCATCHDQIGDRAQLTPNRNVTGCESCHGGGKLHVDAGGMGPIGFTAVTSSVLGTVPVSALFMTCTYCHELLDSTGTPSAGPKTPSFHQTDPAMNILDTHMATAGTWSYTDGSNMGSGVSGYAMDFNSETVCTNCHNPHGTADINREWLYSAHADTLTGKAWTFYNWSCDGTYRDGCGKSSAFSPISDRRKCQRCHTTTGFAAYAEALRTGDAARAALISSGTASPMPVAYTQGTSSTGSYASEMLHCNGCHTNNRGTLRNPGGYTAPYAINYSGSDKAVASATYPDVAGSNVCVACHSGRVSGDSIKALNTTTTATIDFGNISTSTFASNFLPHNFASAGVMFAAIGYEYSGRSYANPSSYRHDQIGTSAVPNTGTNGPCVGCHMFRTDQPGNHTFMPVSKIGGTVTSVTSEVCYNCHAGSSSQLADVVQNEEEDFLEALTVLNWALTAATFTPSSGFPPFLNTKWTYTTDADWTGNTTGKNNMGAAFNYSLLNNEPAAFVHNRAYVKRLIYDSIDWLDNRQMDYSVGSRLATLCGVTPCDKAKNYLLPYGVLTGAPAERP